MASAHGSPDTLEQHQHEVCNAFARAAAAMRDAAHTAENFSNWFSRVNNLQNLPVPPMFNGGQYNFVPNYGGPQQQPQYAAPQPAAEQTGKKRKAAGDPPEGKKKRQTKEKKPKDVNAPKRPASAYLLFQNEVRKTVQAEHPDMPYNQILGEISKLWHAMSAEEKAPYNKATADHKVQYEKAKADYEATSPTAEGAQPIPVTSKTAATPAAAVGVSKTAVNAQPATTSDSSEESSETNSSGEEENEEEEEEEDEHEPKPEPEPPRKKSKKEAAKVPTPPPAKVEKKKSGEGKKKKKVDT